MRAVGLVLAALAMCACAAATASTTQHTLHALRSRLAVRGVEDEWEAGSFVAKGGTSNVYEVKPKPGTEAAKRHGSKRCVVKVVALKDKTDAQVKAALREAEYHSALTAKCPKRVVPLLAWWVEQSGGGVLSSKKKAVALHMVLERVDGGEMAGATSSDGERLVVPHYSPFREPAHGAHGLNRYIGLVAAMVKAVRCVHTAGYVHRDIKPENFLLSADKQRVLLADFGESQTEADVEALRTTPGLPPGGTVSAHATSNSYEPPGSLKPIAGPNEKYTEYLEYRDFTFELRRLWDSWALGMTALGLWYGGQPRDVIAVMSDAPIPLGDAGLLAVNLQTRVKPDWNAAFRRADSVLTAPAAQKLAWQPPQHLPAAGMPQPMRDLLADLMSEHRDVFDVALHRLPFPAEWTAKTSKDLATGQLSVVWAPPAREQVTVYPRSISPNTERPKPSAQPAPQKVVGRSPADPASSDSPSGRRANALAKPTLPQQKPLQPLQPLQLKPLSPGHVQPRSRIDAPGRRQLELPSLEPTPHLQRPGVPPLQLPKVGARGGDGTPGAPRASGSATPGVDVKPGSPRTPPRTGSPRLTRSNSASGSLKRESSL